MADSDNFNPEKILWDDEPSTAQPTLIPIVSAIPQTAQLLVVLGDRVCGVYTHFYLERTVPCLGAIGNCVCQSIAMSKRWKGYLGAYDTFSERMVLAEITMEAYRLCPGLHVQSGLNRRVLRLFKSGKKKQSPARAELLGSYDGPLLLPPCPDVRDALCRIWSGVTRDRHDEE